ncbi:MAG: zinc-binding dehydrogenase [Gemmatimonadetes bacterium]|nr:zinc-binding dehydrogenase [Gemmatimonadota bacterium]NNM05143.1 zinc-binding dehydrogenase [Gemmatimonadota bacterium]
MPRTTVAIQIPRFGSPEVMEEREIQLPDPGPGELHLRVAATGVNFADLLQRVGLYGKVPDLPYAPGFEVAGQVAGVGDGVEGWKEGDRAVALLRFGGYAKDVIVGAEQAFPYPETLSPIEAAGIPVVFLTAWVCLFETGHAREGDSALTLGAGGGVGTAAVQLAVDRGLRVYGTAGKAEKRAFVVDELGAEACFDSRGAWADELFAALGGKPGLDIALDPVGGPATKAIRRMLNPLGRVVFYGMSEAMPGRKRSWPKAALARFRTGSIHPLSLVIPNQGVFGVHLLYLKEKEAIMGPALEEIFRGVVDGRWKPIMDRTFPMDQDGAVEAHRYLHDRKNLGKVVLEAP